MSSPEQLISIFHRRWSSPLLAELSRDDGAKFVTLVHRLGASHGAVRDALADLIDAGWVAPNPGHGHPLRPEYILTRRGTRVGALCATLEDEVARLGSDEIVRRKWSMPTLWTLRAGPSRFADIGRRLEIVTDRALARALRDLDAGGLIERDVIDGRPPTPIYAPTRGGGRFIPVLERLAG